MREKREDKGLLVIRSWYNLIWLDFHMILKAIYITPSYKNTTP